MQGPPPTAPSLAEHEGVSRMAGAEAADEVVAGHWQSAVRGSAGVEVGPTCLGRSSPGRAGLRARREGVSEVVSDHLPDDGGVDAGERRRAPPGTL